MRYVHPACLEAWRRRSHQNAVSCGVCGARYTHVWIPRWGLAEMCYAAVLLRRLVSLTQRAAWTHGGPARRALKALAFSPEVEHCVLRLLAWTVLFYVAVVAARLATLVIVVDYEVVIGIDKVVDPILFPVEALDTVRAAFPALSGFGYLGVHDAVVQAGEAVAASSPQASYRKALEMLEQQLQHVAAAIAKVLAQRSAGLWRLPGTLDDAALGTLMLLLGVQLLSVAPGLPLELREVLDRVPSPVTDARTLLQELAVVPGLVPAFLCVLLPLSVYGARWLLSWCCLLPMEALPVDQHMAAHIWMGLTLMGLLSLLHSLHGLVREDFLDWYATFACAVNGIGPT
eukprot:CAMPEP_0171065552 /NCGR_PEP_ID=MMETSP0766_2-20121228/6908_1 /TAXON_ID=439317 /ORGANISM="Gambierdiscus australes, Strain CAWD 149" /LENGTH=343 /DNA_ID=CAMNT_0011521663 /DNA_START=194 /DNA_END=1225 /DNA_ORIENTATION=-